MNIFFVPTLRMKEVKEFIMRFWENVNEFSKYVKEKFIIGMIYLNKGLHCLGQGIKVSFVPMLKVLLIALLFVLLVYLTFYFIAYACPFAKEVLASRVIAEVGDLTVRQEAHLQDLIKNNKVLTAPFILERITSFYELLISFVLGLGFVVAVIGYLYVKSSYKIDILEAIDKEKEKGTFKDIIDKVFNKSLIEGELKYSNETMELLTKRVEWLEKALNEKSDVLEIPEE